MPPSGDDKPKPMAFGDRELSDVTLIVGQQEFLVHKMVLACRSAVFKDLFYVKEANQAYIRIRDASSTVFQLLLEILYDGAVKNRANMFPGLCYCNYVKVDEILRPDCDIVQLLGLADRFKLTRMVKFELKEGFGQIRCHRKLCSRCMIIHYYLYEQDKMAALLNKVAVGPCGNRRRERSRDCPIHPSVLAAIVGANVQEVIKLPKSPVSAKTSFGDRELSDVTLVVENRDFPVHKMTLASRSDVFKMMFYGQFKEANEDRIELKDVSATCFQHLLELLYNGTVRKRDKLFPSRCDCDNADFGYFKRKGLEEIWSWECGLIQLLEVADRFNLTQLAVRNILDAFYKVPCESWNCFRCFSISLLLLDRGVTQINRRFARSSLIINAISNKPKVLFFLQKDLSRLLERLW